MARRRGDARTGRNGCCAWRISARTCYLAAVDTPGQWPQAQFRAGVCEGSELGQLRALVGTAGPVSLLKPGSVLTWVKRVAASAGELSQHPTADLVRDTSTGVAVTASGRCLPPRARTLSATTVLALDARRGPATRRNRAGDGVSRSSRTATIRPRRRGRGIMSVGKRHARNHTPTLLPFAPLVPIRLAGSAARIP